MKGHVLPMNDYLERTAMLYGEEAVEKLSRCRVAVFGIGGVGGHATEALARCGVGEITVIDNDTVSVSNINRQIVALRSTVGRYKTDVIADRIADINPDCRVNVRREFVLPENIDSFELSSYDYVIDAIDTVAGKLAIIKACDAADTPCISAMGAGNKLDPTKFVITDIYKTTTCPLAAVIRRECRKSGVRRLKVVYSTEEALAPAFTPASDGNTRKRTPASAAFTPAVCGLMLASAVVEDLVRTELSRSLEMRKNND